MKNALLYLSMLLLCSSLTFAQSSPTQLSPANGSTGILTNANTLSWYFISTTPVSYNLQVSLSQSFSGSMVLNTTITGGTNYYNNIPGLFGGTTYYWRVNATNAQGTSNWSSTWSFSTSGTPPNPFTIVSSAGANGSISPSGNVLVTPGSDKAFTITPNSGYVINDVLVDGVSVGAINNYTFTSVAANHSISASFLLITHDIIASAGSHGSITPSGTLKLVPGSSQAFTITPDLHYHVADVLVDGASVGALTNYTFSNIQAPHTISASFVIDSLKIKVTSTSGGIVTPSTNVTVPYGGNKTLTFTPNPGFFVIDRIVKGVSMGEGDSYTFTNVTSNDTIHVVFTDHYNILASAGAHGSINPSGSVNASKGGDKQFTITPNFGYHIADVLVDGISVGAVPDYTFNNVQTHHTISATFAINSYTITVTKAGMGSIVPSGDQTLQYGDTLTFDFNPAPGYFVTDVLVDSISVGDDTSYTFTHIDASHTLHVIFSNRYTITKSSTAGGYITPLNQDTINAVAGSNVTLQIALSDYRYHFVELIVDGVSVDSSTTYTFANIDSNHTVHAVFDHIIDTLYTSVYGDSGGTISPSGNVLVIRGEPVTLHFTPLPGYTIRQINFNGNNANYLDSTLFLYSLNGSINVTVYFGPIHNIYVAPHGNDFTNDGSEAFPYRTIQHSFEVSLPGDTIIADNGVYNEYISILPGRNFIGGTATYVDRIVGNNIEHFLIKNVNIYNSYNNGDAFISLISCRHFILDNVNVNSANAVACSLTTSSDFTLKNSIYTNSMKGLQIINSNNFNLLNFISNFNLTGIELDSVSSFNLNNVTTSNNANFGIYIDNAKIGTIKNLTSNNNGINNFNNPDDLLTGLIISSSANLNFINGKFYNNRQNGITITNSNYLNLSQAYPTSTSNITFNGNIDISRNMYGIFLNTNSNNSFSVVSPVFDGHITMNDNYNEDVHIENRILNPVFKGIVFAKNNVNFNIDTKAFNISGLAPSGTPKGVVINYCTFSYNVMKAIYLNPYTTGLRVDGRFNSFTGAIPNEFNNNYGPYIKDFIYDSTDSPFNTTLGTVDTTGSTTGLFSTIRLENINGYKGGSYLVDVNVDGKQNSYYYIKGKFLYLPSYLKYLGFVSNGLFNKKQWTTIITETTPGTIEFTGYGTTPIYENGALFSLNMQIAPFALDTISYMGGNPIDFIGNDSLSAFHITPSIFIFHDAPGPLQSRGDVTLDGAVSNSDFMALLYHLGGTIILTDPQALINADFDLDGDIDNDDLDALYTFIQTGQLPNAVLAGIGHLALNNASYDEEKTSALIPVGLQGADNLRSLEITLTYDASLINYKAFSSSLDLESNLVYAFESKPGEVKFVFNASSLQKGDINPGEILLSFKNSKIPVGAEVQSYYRMNGGEMQRGPKFQFTETGVVTAVEEAESVIPDKYDISQNYPNPFNPVTNIRYSIPEASNVTIKIYNMLGQEVRTLVNEFRNPGFYEAVWNGTSESGITVASGTYVYRIISGNFVQTKKMIFLK